MPGNESDVTGVLTDPTRVRAALGTLEAAIMAAVWRRPPGAGVTVREVWEGFYPARPTMYTTVMNAMARLAKKGLLAVERNERAFVYLATLDRETPERLLTDASVASGAPGLRSGRGPA